MILTAFKTALFGWILEVKWLIGFQLKYVSLSFKVQQQILQVFTVSMILVLHMKLLI